ncbi:MAG: DUF4159 domain-containing protein [Bacteroidales bacterium]|jgi:hypothetical protein|nr:DUF4159 domain-containing protein [Bacteroidales bacterium]MDD2322498.1 DUF4159 domain-containing protein [Bacteroidales bacterium]MDD3009926.1 DUF4159 domain-containing protein [Bacteroidales bacterium]MDD3960484.1 DUF4159 domain-containing protein [Bacteroidales bacterium]MDY0285069.1 DUF4159 domain-containing protein [Bacteroidales bacterium]
MKKSGIILLLLSFIAIGMQAQPGVKIALLKYRGGGDWYANPTSLSNLIAFCNTNIGTRIEDDYAIVEAGSRDLFNYPFVHITGHGNILFNDSEARNLREYLLSGGFLHIDDNYGLDQYVRPQMAKIFPELEFVELPYSHPIYHQVYSFEKGLPKIHEHDNKAPQGFGLLYEGRLVCFYTYECDLGDGWEDTAVHNDSEETHQKALKMGANIIKYAFTQE